METKQLAADVHALGQFVLALQGHLMALDALAFALIDSHPDAARLHQDMQARVAQATRLMLPATPDAQRLRFEETAARFEDHALAILRERAGRA